MQIKSAGGSDAGVKPLSPMSPSFLIPPGCPALVSPAILILACPLGDEIAAGAPTFYTSSIQTEQEGGSQAPPHHCFSFIRASHVSSSLRGIMEVVECHSLIG